MGTATYIKDSNDNMSGDARLYRLDPPHDGEDLVIVSGIDNGHRHETYIFPANEQGQVTDWLELEGSFQGSIDHDKALRGLGYEISED